MKILRVTTADISLDMLLKGQLRYLNQYFEVVGVSADTGLLKGVAEREGIRVIDLPMHREISLFADVKSLLSMIKLMRKEKPDVVHANTPKGSLLSLFAAKLMCVPNRVYLVTGLRYQGTSGMLRLILKTMEKISCFCATKVIPEGQGVRKALMEDHITMKPLNVLHNGNINGIDTGYFSVDAVEQSREDLRASLNLKSEDFVFVFVGRIVKDKGMNELAGCMRKLKESHGNCKLILVGSFESELDPLSDGNEEFFKTDDSIRFVGWQNDVRPYLKASDALVFPSYREGFPNVVMQAGAMELPSLVTDINGSNEIIKDGVNGLIIPAKNEPALYDAMKSFVEDSGMIAHMSAVSREMICSRYEQRDVWEALRHMYESL